MQSLAFNLPRLRRAQQSLRIKGAAGGLSWSARLDLAHRAEAVVRGVDVDNLRLRGHQVGCGVKEPLYVGLLEVRAARLGILEALDADELVVVGESAGELEEQAAFLGVDVLGVGVGQRQPLVHLFWPDLHLEVDQDHGFPPAKCRTSYMVVRTPATVNCSHLPVTARTQAPRTAF